MMKYITNFFYYGPFGSGKTYLYSVLKAYYRRKGETVLTFATTGISALLFKGGRTAHSGFKLSIPMLDHSTMNMNFADTLNILKEKLIIDSPFKFSEIHQRLNSRFIEERFVIWMESNSLYRRL